MRFEPGYYTNLTGEVTHIHVVTRVRVTADRTYKNIYDIANGEYGHLIQTRTKSRSYDEGVYPLDHRGYRDDLRRMTDEEAKRILALWRLTK